MYVTSSILLRDSGYPRCLLFFQPASPAAHYPRKSETLCDLETKEGSKTKQWMIWLCMCWISVWVIPSSLRIRVYEYLRHLDDGGTTKPSKQAMKEIIKRMNEPCATKRWMSHSCLLNNFTLPLAFTYI